MNATVGGTIGGIQSGDAVTKIELVWKSGAETEDQAMAAGRGVTLTAAGDITAFQAGTYALSSAALVSGQTYTPAARITESRSGIDGFVGGWASSNPITPAAPLATFSLASFTGSSGTAPNAALFTVASAGGGTAQLDGSGNLRLLASSGAAAVMVGAKNGSNLDTAVRTEQLKININTFGGAVDSVPYLGVWDLPTVPVPDAGVAYPATAMRLLVELRHWTTGESVIDLAYRDTSNVFNWWSGTAWVTSPPDASNSAILVAGTDYYLTFEATSTQYRFTCGTNADPSIATGRVYQTAWFNKSLVKAFVNTPKVIIGDTHTDGNVLDMLIKSWSSQ